MRKGTWWLLVAVIVGTQVFTMGCDARCGKMALTDPAIAAQGQVPRAGSGNRAGLAPPAVSHCKDLLCKSDAAFLTVPFALSVPGNAVLAAMIDIHRSASEPIVEPLRCGLRRSSSPASAFDPVLSSLRI